MECSSLADTNNVIIPGASGEVNSITDLGNNTYKLSIKVNGINNTRISLC